MRSFATFAFGQEDTNNDRITIKWTDTPEDAVKQFRSEWLQGDGMTRSETREPPTGRLYEMMLIAFYLHFCYSIPSLILYALTIFVCIRDRKELKGTFYAIYKVSFIVDCLSYFSNFLGLWILIFHGLNGWLLSLNQYPTLLSAILYANKITLHAQNFRCMLSCLHRLTSIAFPVSSEPFWQKMTVPLLCCIPVWGGVAAMYAWFLDGYYLEENNQVYWRFENPSIAVYPILGLSIFYMVTNSIWSSCTIRLLQKHKRDAIAVNICRITFFCFIIQLINLLTMMAIGFSQMYDWDISLSVELNVLPFTRDAYSFSYPWCTFLMNKDIRRRTCALLHLRSSKISSTQSSSLGQNPHRPLSSTQLQTLSAVDSTNRVQFTLETIEMEKE